MKKMIPALSVAASIASTSRRYRAGPTGWTSRGLDHVFMGHDKIMPTDRLPAIPRPATL